MAESTANAYRTKSDNTADTTPTPVAVVTDSAGNDRQIVAIGAGDGTTTNVGVSTAAPASTDAGLITRSIEATGLVPLIYDYLSLGYTGANLTTLVYKTGGAGGTTVATLTLTYSSGKLSSIART